MLTIKELSSQTGLTENVIRKHMRLLGSFLRPYIKRGQSNKLLFDPNCVVVSNEIKKVTPLVPSGGLLAVIVSTPYLVLQEIDRCNSDSWSRLVDGSDSIVMVMNPFRICSTLQSKISIQF